jgi:hypothetical protein
MTMSLDFDFDRSVEQAWRRFTLRLADVVSVMDETEPLTLRPYDCAECLWYVQFRCTAKERITVEVPLGADRVAPDQVARLAGLGWRQGPGEMHLTDDQDHSVELARTAVQVLRDVFHIAHPVFLDSNVLAEVLQEPAPVQANQPGAVVAYANLDEVQLAAAVAEELTEIFAGPPMRDQDGDFAIRVGSTMVFVRVSTDGKEIRLFSVLVHDVTGRSRASEILNDVNAHARWVRFALVRDKIIGTLSVFASPFVPAHLRQAITEIAHVADGVDDLLAASLQGKTTFPAE